MYATATTPIPTTIVSNATIIACDNAVTFPIHSAAIPGPIGINVPIDPTVGPNLVTMSVFSTILSIWVSSLSMYLFASAGLDLFFKFSEEASSIRIFSAFRNY